MGEPVFQVCNREMEWCQDMPVMSSAFDGITSSTDVVAAAQARKRPGRDDNHGPPKKRPATIPLGGGARWNLGAIGAAADAVELNGKSPVSVLNEMGTNVVYRIISQSGPPHCPSFTISVTVANLTFEGWGRNKREARTAAARLCLAALRARAGWPHPQRAACAAGDSPLNGSCPAPALPSGPFPPIPLPEPNGAQEKFPSPRPQQPAQAEKSPINALYECYSAVLFTCTYGDGTPLTSDYPPAVLGHSQRFKSICTIDGKSYEGYGSSKKTAKLAAARAAIAVLTESGSPMSAQLETWSQHDSLPQILADHVGKLVNEKFQELMKSDPLHAKRKVLAGIVITSKNQLDGRVLCVTTGTKCISGEYMSVRGLAINDCHAEVVARRCLQTWLYDQLYMYTKAYDPTCPIPASDLEPLPGGGYRLRESRRLHLYVSTAPCGDGRIFSPHEDMGREPDKHPNRLARGQLRTKIESGEGTIPVKNQNQVQTWDGVLQGERLLTMSCSDKLARWNAVGLQGALLSSYVAPLYYHSVVLGSLLHQQHLYRALCGRIESTLEALPPPFRLQRPLLARAASAEVRTPARAPSFSVNWCAGRPTVEVVNASTGKLESGAGASAVCKQSLFARWRRVASRLPPLLQRDVFDQQVCLVNRDKLDGILYVEAKQLCPAYQQAKWRLASAFVKAQLGLWVKKPLEQDQFVCETDDTAFS